MSGACVSSKQHQNLRWMRFVDGENLVFQGTKFLERNFPNVDLGKLNSDWYEPERLLWLPAHGWSAVTNYNLAPHWIGAQSKRNSQAEEAVRAYYYTMVAGARERDVPNTEDKLWKLGFTPRIFWKSKQDRKSKAVDSSISIDMLSAAYEDQFDVVEIWTGDADYLPLVEAVKRLGKVVVCCFFGEEYGLSRSLKVACDRHCDISDLMFKRWQGEIV